LESANLRDEEAFESLIVGAETIEILAARVDVSADHISRVSAKQKAGDRSLQPRCAKAACSRINPARNNVYPLHGLGRQACGIAEKKCCQKRGP